MEEIMEKINIPQDDVNFLQAQYHAMQPEELQQKQIVIKTYGTLSIEAMDVNSTLWHIKFKHIIADKADVLKNSASLSLLGYRCSGKDEKRGSGGYSPPSIKRKQRVWGMQSPMYTLLSQYTQVTCIWEELGLPKFSKGQFSDL
ncbi:hypothetical protein K7432_009146 [Basidiobolus ranarum]|uniref:Uncharacterized protein n=1 Tax=Basidiobolus ranarum TaxID=34480 RepID=A0ABR2VYA1_9FUNG